MQQDKIKCAILGLGNQAFEHLYASVEHPDIEIIAGVDQQKASHSKAQQQFPSLHCFESLTDLQNSDLDIDALILALPHHAYEHIWADLMEWGKPLLKEKPLGRDYQEAKSFMQQAQQAQCGLQTAIQRRQHPSYKFLAEYLQQHQIAATEVHAHLHLGKGREDQYQQVDLGWRGKRLEAGGGALLDTGYHLIDLVQFLIGDFDVISSTMWNGTQADNGVDIEDRCWLTGRSCQTWIMIDTWVKGKSNGQGGYLKSEEILLQTAQGIFTANREGVWLNDQTLFSSEKEWLFAMRQQLHSFAQNVRLDYWYDDVILDQLPAMHKIEEAYRLSSRY